MHCFQESRFGLLLRSFFKISKPEACVCTFCAKFDDKQRGGRNGLVIQAILKVKTGSSLVNMSQTRRNTYGRSPIFSGIEPIAENARIGNVQRQTQL